MARINLIPAVLLCCAACGMDRSAPANEGGVPEPPDNAVAATDDDIRPGAPGGLPDDRSPVEEGPIEPNSGQGAAQVLQHYAALLEQRRFADAYRLWSGDGQASGLDERGFAQTFAPFSEIHAEIGAPGRVEGAAGSLYVEVPIRFYGKRAAGTAFSSVGTATLRRVNEVPGSSARQRRWHLAKIDVQPPL